MQIKVEQANVVITIEATSKELGVLASGLLASIEGDDQHDFLTQTEQNALYDLAAEIAGWEAQA